jgi:hypothetical protein
VLSTAWHGAQNVMPAVFVRRSASTAADRCRRAPARHTHDMIRFSEEFA